MGSEITLNINNNKTKAVILAIDTDVLEDGSKAKLTIMPKSMNHNLIYYTTASYSGSYGSYSVNYYKASNTTGNAGNHRGLFESYLEAWLADRVVPVVKYTTLSGSDRNHKYIEKYWLLSGRELNLDNGDGNIDGGGNYSNKYCETTGVRYNTYFNSNEKRIRYKQNGATAIPYALRTGNPCTGYPKSVKANGTISEYGNSTDAYTGYSGFCFCIN